MVDGEDYEHDLDAELAYEQEMENEQIEAQLAPETFEAGSPVSPTSSDTADTRSVKRLRTERGFVSKRASRKADDPS